MSLNYFEEVSKKEDTVFLQYDGFITQDLIVTMTESIEKESERLSLTVRTNLITIFIELTQNMMNYSKDNGKGMILVAYNKKLSEYYVISKNRINLSDKECIDAFLNKIIGLNANELRSYYRQARKEGNDKHIKGAGIGFIEIARKCDEINYDFKEIENLYDFTFKAILKKE